VSSNNNDDAKKDAELAMKIYLQIPTDDQLRLTFEKEIQHIHHLYDGETGWKVKFKEEGLLVCKLQEKGIITWKGQTKLKFTKTTVDSLIHFFASGNTLKEDKRVEGLELVERYNENTADWRFCTRLLWPLAPREWLLRRNKVIEDRWTLVLDYSITRDDYPPTKSAVRGVACAGVFFEVDKDCEPGEVIFTQIYSMDPKGNVPTWIINKAGPAVFRFLKKLRTMV